MDRNTSAVHRVAGELVARIADGSWRAGERIPGEHALARRFGVSRPTVREAIGMLSARGLLHVRPRSGTYVAGEISSGEMKALTDLISVDPGRIWELLEIRRIVDTAAAELAAARRSEEDLQRLQELARSPGLRSPRELIEQPEGGRAYGRFFALLARATGNGLFEHLVCFAAAQVVSPDKCMYASSSSLIGSNPAVERGHCEPCYSYCLLRQLMRIYCILFFLW